MPNQNQKSIISYVPQPYFVAGSCTVVGYDSIDSIENSEGIFDPDLSNYSTFEPSNGAEEFAIQIDFDKNSEHLINSQMSLGLIGCSLLTYEDDAGSPDLATEFSENIFCNLSSNVTALADELASYAHNSQDKVTTFCGESLPSVIAGGRSNLIFPALGVSGSGSSVTLYASFTRKAADALARPHAKLIIGHLFVGVDIEVQLDPRTFSWTMHVETERFRARDFGAVNSDGTLIKRSNGDIKRIDNFLLMGSEITDVATEVEVTTRPNFFDLIKANTSYPLLFNCYPAPAVLSDSITSSNLNLTARQNFFSIYGFFEEPLEILPGEFRDELASEYTARFRIQETR